MNRSILLAFCGAFIFVRCKNQTLKTEKRVAWYGKPYAIAIWRRCGNHFEGEYDEEKKEPVYLAALDTALSIGETYKNGGSALMQLKNHFLWRKTVRCLILARWFWLIWWKNELDASIMDGSNQTAGAVGGVRHRQAPDCAGPAVMEKSPRFQWAWCRATQEENGLEIVDPFLVLPRRPLKLAAKSIEKEMFNGKPEMPVRLLIATTNLVG